MKKDRYVHFSSFPVDELEPREQQQDWLQIGKPTGLWISVESERESWSSFCKTGTPDDRDRLKYAYEVTLKKEAKLLKLRSVDEVLLFSRAYPKPREQRIVKDLSVDAIDWESVIKKFDGMIISPYQWSLRFHDEAMWYCGWDVASGCIWNTEAIEGMTPIDSSEFKREDVHSAPT